MASNIYKQFYGQGNGGYTAEHQLQGRVRRSAQSDAGSNAEPEQYVPRRRAKELDADDFMDLEPHAAPTPQPEAPAPAPVVEPVAEPAAPAPVTEPVAEPAPAPVAEPVVAPAPVPQSVPVQPVAPAPQPTPVASVQPVVAPAQPVAPVVQPVTSTPAPVIENNELEIIEEAMGHEARETVENIVQNEEAFGDDLLAQIDAFRQKAEQLQELIAKKQERAEQLKNIVEAKESQVQGLEGLLAKSHEQNQEMANDLKSNVYGQINQLRQDMNSQILAMSGEVKNQIDSVTASLSSLQGADLEGVTNEVKSLKSNMDELQNAITEKVHSESVASYRNTADLLKDINIEPTEEEKKGRQRLEGQVKGTRGSIRFLTVFSIVNFALLAVLSLFTMGFFSIF